MNDVRFPKELRLELLTRSHRRKAFSSGERLVDEWLLTKAMQQQEKHLSATKVLVDREDQIAGFFTLASGQIDFGDLPEELARKLPRRVLPIATLAWLGVAKTRQGNGLGTLLLAQALRDCFIAGQTFSFIAVILDCLNDRAKDFYQQFEFTELPGRPYRLYLSAAKLQNMMQH